MFFHFADGAARFGYICWAIIAKPTIAVPGGQPSTRCGVGEFLGWAGIVTPALEDPALGPELAYLIASRFHGQGLITEAAATVARDAFPRYGLSALHAVMDAPNTASMRVAEKLGFTYQGTTTVYGSEDMVLYALSKHAALKQEAAKMRKYTMPRTAREEHDPHAATAELTLQRIVPGDRLLEVDELAGRVAAVRSCRHGPAPPPLQRPPRAGEQRGRRERLFEQVDLLAKVDRARQGVVRVARRHQDRALVRGRPQAS